MQKQQKHRIICHQVHKRHGGGGRGGREVGWKRRLERQQTTTDTGTFPAEPQRAAKKQHQCSTVGTWLWARAGCYRTQPLHVRDRPEQSQFRRTPRLQGTGQQAEDPARARQVQTYRRAPCGRQSKQTDEWQATTASPKTQTGRIGVMARTEGAPPHAIHSPATRRTSVAPRTPPARRTPNAPRTPCCCAAHTSHAAHARRAARRTPNAPRTPAARHTPATPRTPDAPRGTHQPRRARQMRRAAHTNRTAHAAALRTPAAPRTPTAPRTPPRCAHQPHRAR